LGVKSLFMSVVYAGLGALCGCALGSCATGSIGESVWGVLGFLLFMGAVLEILTIPFTLSWGVRDHAVYAQWLRETGTG
jgi:hypothetical protein